MNELLKIAKIELICLLFGSFGMFIAIYNEDPTLGVGLSSTSITSYFAFKKIDEKD